MYDAVIIGAGMSGLAAGIRLAMFDKKVLILEKHIISGGLNSYYSRREKSTKEILDFDVGLHALTNFAKKGERRKPLTKLLKQLRIPYDSLKLCEQTHSLIQFKSENLKFSNDFELLESEIAKKFPKEIDQFRKFVLFLNEFNEVDLKNTYLPAREKLGEYFTDKLLIEMILAPLLIYGSAWENDMDFSQFAIMFKSIYMEGFSRPEGGVRTILNLLESRYAEVGGEIKYRALVENIDTSGETKIIHLKNGESLKTKMIFSSAGLPETNKMLETSKQTEAPIGKLSFMESLIVLKDKTPLKNFDPTIVFYNDSDIYTYKKPTDYFDASSAVFCLPDNYERNKLGEGHGIVRVTYMANFDLWNTASKEKYKEMKERVLSQALELSSTFLKSSLDVFYQDVFSPRTIKKYTGHIDGTVYGSTLKKRDGKSGVDGVYLIGTDQGFLGIVGAMLSGISIANLYGLQEAS